MQILVNQALITGSTFLSKDYLAATTSFNVENSEQFVTANGLVVFGIIGSPNAECINVLSSKTATSLNMGSGSNFVHQRGEPVQQVTYNQVVIESSTSATGTFTVLATIPIQWSALTTEYNDTAGTSATYYRQRSYNSVTGYYSDYSNGGIGVSQNDYGPTTAGSLITSVRNSTGNQDLSNEFFIAALNDARRIANTEYGYGMMCEWRANFEAPIQMLAGNNFVNLPSDIDFTETNRALLNARYSRQSVSASLPLKYVDKREWNNWSWQNRPTYTSGATLSAATSIVLQTTGDLPSTGTIYIATELPTQSVLAVAYTGNNLLTNTLTGCTGITRNVSSGIQIMGYPSPSYPYIYTVFEGKIWFNSAIPTTLQGKNLYIDYYTQIVDVVFLSDVVPEHYRDVYKNYLKFAIKHLRDSTIGKDDADYQLFDAGLKNIQGNPYTGQSIIIIT